MLRLLNERNPYISEMGGYISGVFGSVFSSESNS